MIKIKLNGYQCERCGHRWVPDGRKKYVDNCKLPRHCPCCKSPYWDRPRRKNKVKQ